MTLVGLLQRLVRASRWRCATGVNVSRFAAYRAIATCRRPWAPEARALAITRSAALAQHLGFRPEQILDTSYPAVDWFALPYAPDTFDAVVADMVLEHLVGDPARAIAESFRVVKPGGIVALTTCWLQPAHGRRDLWRFSPDALRWLATPYGEILLAEGWGNWWVMPYLRLGLRHDGIPLAPWHPLHRLATVTDPGWEMTTWLVAQKADARLTVRANVGPVRPRPY